MKKFFTLLTKTMKLAFIAFLVFLGSLFFRSQHIPADWVESALKKALPETLLVQLDSISFGVFNGLTVKNLRVFDLSESAEQPIASAKKVTVYPLRRLIVADALRYPRLPAGYYVPGNQERNERVQLDLPAVPRFSLCLIRPEILGVTPDNVIADVEIHHDRLSVSRIHLDWAELSEPIALDGFCSADFSRQVVQGEVYGFAKQYHIRPLLVALDIPISVEYMDAFTEVPGRIPARCGWNVNLINNDFTLTLDLKPDMGKYNGVALAHAESKLMIQTHTVGTNMNYKVTVGPLAARGVNAESLNGSVIITGQDNNVCVEANAKSNLPVAQLLKIAGFTGDYVDESMIGEAQSTNTFRFPDDMGSDVSKLNGEGHFELNGQVFRMKGFAGLLELLATRVPGVASITDSTSAKCDYTIRNGILHTENAVIDGKALSILMYGDLDLTKDELNFNVRVRFASQDSFVGKVLHPLTSPVSMLLLEFRLTGSTEHPKWEYLSVIDRVWEAAQ